MIKRYTPSDIGGIWTDEEKFKRFLRIEALFCEALEKKGEVPVGTAAKILKAKIDVAAIQEIEKQTHHDIIAFLKHISPQIGKAATHLHIGMTSSDLLDTTLATQIKDATTIILKDLDALIKEVKKKADKYKNTYCMGRTHGVHAEIYSFGLKFLYLYTDLKQHRKFLADSLGYTAAGKVSGAVGTFAYFDPKIEEYICKKMGITNALVSTQVVSRERIAYYISVLALLAASIERFATEIRHLHRIEVNEAKEPFYKGQKGSSAMPHKQNPIMCERLCGLARLIRGNMVVAHENINLWHERDISHSSAERVILPDSTITIVYMLRVCMKIVKDLKVNKDDMAKNIEMNRGIIYSQKILVSLMRKGIDRMVAYDMVQSVSLKVINNKTTFKDEILQDKPIRKYLTEKEIKDIFEPKAYLANISKIYKRVEKL